MLKTIIILLIGLWLLGLLIDIAGALIHVVLVIAAGLYLYNYLRSRSTAP